METEKDFDESLKAWRDLVVDVSDSVFKASLAMLPKASESSKAAE